MPRGIKGSGKAAPVAPKTEPVVFLGLPTRGLLHSRTLATILANTEGKSIIWKLTHDEPIPDSFNTIANDFMDSSATHLWIVEEDMELPPTILEDMLAVDKPFVTTDYPTTLALNAIQQEGKYVIGGLGCVLVTREVLEAVKVPYFRSVARAQGTMKILDQTVMYGMHDVDFYVRAQDAGYTPYVMPEELNQWRLKATGEVENNQGTHLIERIR